MDVVDGAAATGAGADESTRLVRGGGQGPGWQEGTTPSNAMRFDGVGTASRAIDSRGRLRSTNQTSSISVTFFETISSMRVTCFFVSSSISFFARSTSSSESFCSAPVDSMPLIA